MWSNYLNFLKKTWYITGKAILKKKPKGFVNE